MMRCSDWLDEESGMLEGGPVFVRCQLDKGHTSDHAHGRYGWNADGWNEIVAPAVVTEIVTMAAEFGDEEAQAYLDEREGKA